MRLRLQVNMYTLRPGDQGNATRDRLGTFRHRIQPAGEPSHDHHSLSSIISGYHKWARRCNRSHCLNQAPAEVSLSMPDNEYGAELSLSKQSNTWVWVVTLTVIGTACVCLLSVNSDSHPVVSLSPRDRTPLVPMVVGPRE
jgi:hypothetical protein